VLRLALASGEDRNFEILTPPQGIRLRRRTL
jgi:hypothetical protein